jgi:hypothetical protein
MPLISASSLPQNIMGDLSSAARKKLPKTKFALPGKRKYPVEDKSHAANAKARATQQMNAGNISKSTRDRIFAAANRTLGKKK